MTTRVAFLRAVNVGRQRRVGMEQLVDLAVGLGHRNPWTYANSGNVVFEGTGRRTALEHGFEEKLAAALDFDVMTCVRSESELRKALALSPFPVEDGDTYFLTFLKKLPSASQCDELEGLGGDFDTLVVAGRDVHWRMRGKSLDTRIPSGAWAAVVGEHRSTSRNTTMLRKLLDKMSD